MKKGITVTPKNIGVVIDRFNKFTKRNGGRKFAVKNIWGKPKKRCDWEGYPQNYPLSEAPIILRHPYFSKGRCLLSVALQNTDDYINMAYGGDSVRFKRDYPNERDLAKHPAGFLAIRNGDRVFFKNEGIIIIPKEHDIVVKKILSVMITTR